MKHILGALCFIGCNSFGQSVQTLIGARQMGMAYASSAITDEWSIFNNVGGIGKHKEKSACAAYEVTPNLVGANRMAFAYNNPFKFGTGSVGVFRFGDDIYSEQILSLGFGNSIGITSLGAKINAVQYNADGFGTRTAMSIDFGGISQLTKEISLAAYITNLTQSSFSGADNYRLPTRLTAGIGLKPSEKIFVTTEIEKDIDFKPTWRTGIEYEALKNFYVRTGFNLNPQNLFAGFGSKQRKVKCDYGIRFNQFLGTSHQISLVYSFTPAR